MGVAAARSDSTECQGTPWSQIASDGWIVGSTRDTFPMSELPMWSGSAPSSTSPRASMLERQRPARVRLSFIVVERPEKITSPFTSAISAAPSTRDRNRVRIESK